MCLLLDCDLIVARGRKEKDFWKEGRFGKVEKKGDGRDGEGKKKERERERETERVGVRESEERRGRGGGEEGKE